MNLSWPVEVAGSGMSVPEKIVTNDDFARRLDTSDEWIVQRTGIRERRMSAPGSATLRLAREAAQRAMDAAGVGPKDIDVIVNATITPEHPLPSTACELQHALGCRWIPSFDLAAACSGFIYGLVNGAQFVVTGWARHALVLGVDCMTRMADLDDRATAVLFGDGAGAVVLRRTEQPGRGILAARLGADGSGAPLIWVPAGGSAEPASIRTVNEKLHHMRMRGREVYKFAITQMQEIMQQTLDDAGVNKADLAMLVPHQSNLRIIEAACAKLGFPLEKVWVNIDRFGNTSAASVPMALHEARTSGRLRPGDLVLLVAFGAGLTWGSVLLRI